MIYFDKDLNMSRKPPVYDKKALSEESILTELMSRQKLSSQRGSKEYTLKDLTRKGTNIKQIFADICPEKFMNKKMNRYSTDPILKTGDTSTSIITNTHILGQSSMINNHKNENNNTNGRIFDSIL